MNNFILKKISKQGWVILTPNGDSLSGIIYLAHQNEAEDYCRAFISCFPNATYDVQICDIIKKDKKE